MPSGKQVLLRVIQEYSQKRQNESELEKVSVRIKSALCAHCSTSGETMEKVGEMSWLSCSEGGEVVKQGLGLANPKVFLSDLFEELIEDTEVPERVKNRFPDLTHAQYNCGLDMIWWLLSSMQYWEELSSVENGGVLEEDEAKRLLSNYKRWLQTYEKDPW